MAITLMDEHGVEWIFTDQDVSDSTLQSFKNIGVTKGELRIWRDHIFSGFLNSPDPQDTLERLLDAIQGAKATGILTDREDLLIGANNLVSHALKSHHLASLIAGRLEKQHGDEG